MKIDPRGDSHYSKLADEQNLIRRPSENLAISHRSCAIVIIKSDE